MARDAAEPHTQTLSDIELKIAQGLMEGRSTRDIGAAIDMSASQVCRIGKYPHVVAYIETLRADIQEQVRRKIVSATTTAADTLLQIARNKGAKDQARVMAARTLLELGFPRDPVRIVHAGEPEAPIQHVLAGVDDSTLDALCLRLGLTP